METSPKSAVQNHAVAYYLGITQALGGQFFEQEHVVWFTTGRRSLPRFNGILHTRTSAQKLPQVLKTILDHFFCNNLPFFCADFPPGGAPGLGEFLRTQGVYLVARTMPAMRRNLVEVPIVDLPNEVEISLVKTIQDQDDWLDVLMRGFPEPVESRGDFHQYLQQSLRISAWRHFLARWGGEPCAISTLLCSPTTCGIYHVTTLPAFRGRGLGRALTVAAMKAGRETGHSFVVLFATPDGIPLYLKLGFETLITADLYAWDGNHA